MAMLKGKAYNLTTSVVGRVESVHTDALGVSHLLRSADPAVPYSLLRAGRPNKGVFIHPSLLLNSPIRFCEGDIIRLTPQGDCFRLYEQAGDDNSLFLTEACNSRCIMCPQPPPENPQTFTDEVTAMLDLMEPSPEVLGITGGEPTFAFNDLLFILKKIAFVHPDCHIQLLTNGRALADFAKAKALTEAGLSLTFCVPLYSDVAHIHDAMVGTNGAFDETLEALGNLIRLSASIEIRMVVTALNYQRLSKWAEFLYYNIPSAAHVAIMGMEPIGRGKTNLASLWVNAEQYSQQIAQCIKKLNRFGMYASLYNYQLCTLPESVHSYAVKSISGWKVRFSKECASCKLQKTCGGFFFSSLAVPIVEVHPVTSGKVSAL